MLDSLLAPRVSQASVISAGLLARAKIPPAHQTALGSVLGLAAAMLVMAGLPLIALLALILGWVLRRLAPATPLDRILDFLFWTALSFGFAIADPPRALAAAFFIFAFAVMDAARSTDPQGTPLLTRPIEQTELLLAFAIACAFPPAFSLVAYIVGILCFVQAGFSLARGQGR